MGYSTDFEGSFSVTPALSENHRAYLNAFAATRRMKRDAAVTKDRPDPLREAVGLPVGPEGAYFVNEDGHAGQGDGRPQGVLNYNTAPIGQPGLWCQWIPTEDGTAIKWDGCEKFYNYIEWLEYLIENFLEPWGYVLEGTCEWQGEDSQDRGRIVVKNNVVKIQTATVTWSDVD